MVWSPIRAESGQECGDYTSYMAGNYLAEPAWRLGEKEGNHVIHCLFVLSICEVFNSRFPSSSRNVLSIANASSAFLDAQSKVRAHRVSTGSGTRT